MCGIFGIVANVGRGVDPATIARGLDLLRHRGPDDAGVLLADWRTGRVAAAAVADTDPALRLPPLAAVVEHAADEPPFTIGLGHRRLSILDLSTAGHQPMASPDGRYWITFNGEIYNYLELRAELAGQGYAFRTGTDTEVILAAYAAWGRHALTRLTGMFAFAVLDLQARTLLLARDFFGIKPLYYVGMPSGIAFASEIPPLLDLPGVSRRADPQRVYDYLRFGHTDHGGGTMFADVGQLPAAHYLELQLDRADLMPSPTRYWDVVPDDRPPRSFDEAAERLREIFLDSVRLHLRSDVPVGACLSGGIDSSAIVTAMRNLGGASLDLHTFSYIASDPALDEERWADIAAAAAGSEMHKVRASAEELAADLDALVALQGEPFGGTSIYAQQLVFRLAHASGMKVMLDGQGADELFLGYRTFVEARVSSLLRSGNVPAAVRFARQASSTRAGFGGAMLRASGRLAPTQLQPALMALVGQPREPAWLGVGWFQRHGVDTRAPRWPRGRDMVRAEAKQALFWTSLPALLRYEDRNSMAYSIESRVPFVTPALASFVFSLPDEYLISPEAVTKAVLRRSLRGLVPDPILDRRDKIGFATPQQSWMTVLRPQLERSLRSDALAGIPALDPAAVWRAAERALAGHQVLSAKLWTWFNLVRWAESFGVEFPA